MSTAIEFKNVVKGFAKRDGSVQYVLDGVNFSIPAGKTTVIAGGSGQGKSVTLKLVLGLMQPDSGQIFIHDQDVTGIRGRELEQLRTKFGVLFQGSALNWRKQSRKTAYSRPVEGSLQLHRALNRRLQGQNDMRSW